MRVFEIFYSLQGEGPNQGLPTVFLRFAGCDLRCTWCDTAYAWSGGREISCEDILNELADHPCKRVCITGGEPLLQKELPTLCELLLSKAYTLSIETGGHHDLSAIPRAVQLVVDLKLAGSGEAGSFCKENLSLLKKDDEIKFVCTDVHDLDEAIDFCKTQDRLCSLVPGVRLRVSPVFGSLDLEAAAKRILHSGLDLGLALQLHKIVWPPDQRGV
jgi:7-carboxy-7-deazaguanine synthase